MAAQIINNYRESADITTGDADCKKKCVQVLEELGLPNGLFPLENIEEFGHNRNAGFMWFIQKKKIEHTFKKIKQVVSYATEVTAFVEKGKLKKITGFLLLRFTLKKLLKRILHSRLVPGCRRALRCLLLRSKSCKLLPSMHIKLRMSIYNNGDLM
jgi:Protein of unknown function, DUF538